METEPGMEKLDFTGTWRFNHQRSLLEIPPPDSTIFVIDHRDPTFRLERTHTTGGVIDRMQIELKAGEGACTQMHGDVEICARLYWEGDALVCESVLKRGAEQGTNVVRYQLSDHGRTLLADETLKLGSHSHQNLWVFDRQ